LFWYLNFNDNCFSSLADVYSCWIVYNARKYRIQSFGRISVTTSQLLGHMYLEGFGIYCLLLTM